MVLIGAMALANCVCLSVLDPDTIQLVLVINLATAIGAASAAVALATVARRHPEIVVFGMLVAIDLATVTIGVYGSSLEIVAAGYLLLLPAVVALAIPWATRIHVAWLAWHTALALTYVLLAPEASLSGGDGGGLLLMLFVAATVSQFGHVTNLRAQVRGFTQIERSRSFRRPLAQIADSLETLAAMDVLALVDELANLARGEQASHIEVHAAPVQVLPEGSVRRVAEALNATISRLQAGAYQFDAAAAAAQEPCRRLLYVGPDDYLLGCTCAEAMGSLLPEGGQVLLVTPNFVHAGVELRRRGFASTLHERFPGVVVVGAVESRLDTAHTSELVRSFIKTHPRLAGIYCTEAVGVLGVMEALGDTGPAGRPIVICHDLMDGTMAGIRAGLVSATITQDPYGQGHDTPIHLFNSLAHGWRPAEPRLITASDLITPDNYRQFEASHLGGMESPAMASRRAKPLGPSRRHLRIAVLGLEDTRFWVQVRDGVLAAAKELAACNASVEWMLPEGDGGFDVATRGLAVQALVREGYDGIATSLHSFDLVPYLNRAVDQGVVVATLNSEASSLQGLVATLSRERKRLEIEASDLEVAASHDPLTDTYNRRVMDIDLEEVWHSVHPSKQPAIVIMIDIDHFKAYNDTYGHAAGDKALRLVARRIQQDIRSRDRLYRYGGEEFLVLLRETRLDVAEAVAARIGSGIEALGLVHKGNPPWGLVTVSSGVAAVDPSRATVAECVAGADEALYRSKRSGRNRVTTYVGAPTPVAKPARARPGTRKKVA